MTWTKWFSQSKSQLFLLALYFIYLFYFFRCKAYRWFATDAVARQQGPSLKVLVAGSVVAHGGPGLR